MTPRQMTLDEALAASRQAIEQVERNADTAWLAEARRLLRTYLEQHEEMFVDDLWTWALARGLGVPREARAMGPVVRYAARSGWIYKTSQARPSVRSRGALKTVWRSRLRGQGDMK